MDYIKCMKTSEGEDHFHSSFPNLLSPTTPFFLEEIVGQKWENQESIEKETNRKLIIFHRNFNFFGKFIISSLSALP